MIKTFFFTVILVFVNFYFSHDGYAVKIVATVNNAAITDVDIDEFAKVLCKIDKNFKCGSDEIKHIAAFTFIETILKQEHIKTTGIDLKQFESGFNDYKKHFLQTLKNFSGTIPDQFNTYLYNEYIWEIMISSQVKQNSITIYDVKNYAEQKKIPLNEENELKIKNILFQQKANELSKHMIEELKKYYLVDIKN